MWEKIGVSTPTESTYRMKTPEGWIVKSILISTYVAIALTTVFDPDHEWFVESTPE